jgi:hypothetical protein
MPRLTNDDDDAFADDILKDGRSFRVPMMMRDSLSPLQRAVAAESAQHWSCDKPLITDASGGTIGLHRPGYRISANDAARTARDEAHAEYEKTLTDAWRDAAGEGSAGQEGAVCTVRNQQFPADQGSPGHLKMRGGKLVCVPDKSRARADAAMTDEREATYQQYDAETAEARPP